MYVSHKILAHKLHGSPMVHMNHMLDIFHNLLNCVKGVPEIHSRHTQKWGETHYLVFAQTVIYSIFLYNNKKMLLMYDI